MIEQVFGNDFQSLPCPRVSKAWYSKTTTCHVYIHYYKKMPVALTSTGFVLHILGSMFNEKLLTFLKQANSTRGKGVESFLAQSGVGYWQPKGVSVTAIRHGLSLAPIRGGDTGEVIGRGGRGVFRPATHRTRGWRTVPTDPLFRTETADPPLDGNL
jgi:hypothetical protein